MKIAGSILPSLTLVILSRLKPMPMINTEPTRDIWVISSSLMYGAINEAMSVIEP